MPGRRRSISYTAPSEKLKSESIRLAEGRLDRAAGGGGAGNRARAESAESESSELSQAQDSHVQMMMPEREAGFIQQAYYIALFAILLPTAYFVITWVSVFSQ